MSTEIKRPRLLGVAQVAQHVRDIDASRAFYRGLLGFEEMLSFSNPDGSLSAALIKIDERQSVQLRPSPGIGLIHLGLETDDAEGMRQYLASQGIAVPAEVQKGRFTACFFSVQDPDGHKVEFMQFTPDSFTLRDLGQHLPPTRKGTHLAFLGLATRDPARARAFYCDLLGCVPLDAGGAERIRLQVPEGQDVIELRVGAGHQLGLKSSLVASPPTSATADPDGTQIAWVA